MIFKHVKKEVINNFSAVHNLKTIEDLIYSQLPENIVLDDIIGIKRDRKVHSHNTIEFQNGIYKILLPKETNLGRNTIVKVLADFNNSNVRTLLNGKLFRIERIRTKVSKKFYE